MIGRKLRGAEERKGWKEGLEIVFEELDVDRVGGPGGVLDFSERIRNKSVDRRAVVIIFLTFLRLIATLI